jgi:hypothetical protein
MKEVICDIVPKQIPNRRYILFFLLAFIHAILCPQEFSENDDYHDFGGEAGITIYGDIPEEFAPESLETHVLNQLNGSLSLREQFIETEFLEQSGFRRTANVKYRKTDGGEKALSVLHGIGKLVSFGIIPLIPFSEIDYDRLAKGQYYSFESVMIKSEFANISPDVWNIMKLEYMLQIEFRNGLLFQDNINYYTDENIEKFESLILKLPHYPASILEAKTRFLDELIKIKASLERHRNPSENYQRAMENLNGFR